MKKVINLSIIFLLLAGLWGCNSMTEKIDNHAEKSKIVIGFKKGVSLNQAEEVLSKYNLEYIKTDNVNMGKIFYNETDERFIVTVPKGQEKEWIVTFNNEPSIRKSGSYHDISEIQVD